MSASPKQRAITRNTMARAEKRGRVSDMTDAELWLLLIAELESLVQMRRALGHARQGVMAVMALKAARELKLRGVQLTLDGTRTL